MRLSRGVGGPSPRPPPPSAAAPLPLDLLVSERIGLDGLEGALEALRRREGARRVVVFG